MLNLLLHARKQISAHGLLDGLLGRCLSEMVPDQLLGGCRLNFDLHHGLVDLHRLGNKADLLHELAHLIWHFLKDFFGEVAALHALSELDELDNVTRALLAVSIGQGLIITIQLLHHFEFLIADTDDDNAHGQVSGFTDQISRFWHIVDFTVRNDQQNVVDSGVTLRTDKLDELAEDGAEFSWPVQLNLRKGVRVALQHALDAGARRLLWQTIESPAVVGFFLAWWGWHV